MAVTTSRVLRLTFTTAGGKTFAITIPNPREDLQQAEAVASHSLEYTEVFFFPLIIFSSNPTYVT